VAHALGLSARDGGDQVSISARLLGIVSHGGGFADEFT